jgi:hypothetical protein
MSHDPKLIEAMARAMCQHALGPKQCPCWGKAFKCADAHPGEQATAALTALCQARPDVEAVLKGEAVAVPREATEKQLHAALKGGPDEHAELLSSIYRNMAAASPYAKDGKRDE